MISKFLRSASKPSISKITSISKLKAYTDIEVLYFDIEYCSLSKIFNIEVFIDFFKPGSSRVADHDCMLQLYNGVTRHRLQCRQFIETQCLALALNGTLSGLRDCVILVA